MSDYIVRAFQADIEEIVAGYSGVEEEACPACSVEGCECYTEVDYADGTEND